MHPDNPLRGIPDPSGLNIYTDGSRDADLTGAGVVILDDGQVCKTTDNSEHIHKYHLGPDTTVFQTEVFAQKMAATLILNGAHGADSWIDNRPITIHSDNQASILALGNLWVKSLLVQETIDLLDRAADCCPRLTIRWVKSHCKHLGNEMADQAARDGRDDSVAPDWETPLLAKAVMHKEIDNMTTRLWQEDWDEYVGCRQTRHFFPTGPRPSFFKQIINLPRIMVGHLIQILTGHTFLKRHQAIIDGTERQRIIEALKFNNDDEFPNADDDGNAIIDAPDPSCSRCGKGEETPLHLLSDCEALGTTRMSIFGKENLVEPGAIPDFSDLPVFKIVSFFKEAKFETLPMHPFLDQYLPTNKGRNADDQGMIDAKKQGFVEGDKWISQYLFHIPLEKKQRKKTRQEDLEALQESDNSVRHDDPIGQGAVELT